MDRIDLKQAVISGTVRVAIRRCRNTTGFGHCYRHGGLDLVRRESSAYNSLGDLRGCERPLAGDGGQGAGLGHLLDARARRFRCRLRREVGLSLPSSEERDGCADRCDTDEDDDRHDLAGRPARRLGSDRLDNHGRYSTLLTSHRWRSSLQVT